MFVRTLSHCSINEGVSNLRRKIYVRRLEVVGERENGRARGRHVSPSRAPVFSCAHYFQVSDLRRCNRHSWGLKFLHAQHPTFPSMVLPETYRACFVSSKFKKKNQIYSIVLLNYRYCFVCYERSDRNMEKRAYHDVPANGNTFASVFLATESSILQCF